MAMDLSTETCLILLKKGATALVDPEDYAALKDYTWRLTSNGYVSRRMPRPDRRTVYLHRQIMCPMSHELVDHINGDTLDNRRSNLRIATKQQNAANSRAFLTNKSTSKYKGVYLSRLKKTNPWIAQIRRNGKLCSLGCYATETEAASAYDHAAIEVHGEFARLNFPGGHEV